MKSPDKSLGQHWLKDRFVLEAIADCADIKGNDTVLEIGPGLGSLTSVLLGRAKRVVAVELDAELAKKLPAQFPGKSLDVHQNDILSFDLGILPSNYIVVANVPYYITSKIVQLLSEAVNPPKKIVMLVQKEVAERLAASAGSMSIMSIAAQTYARTYLGPVVPSTYFTPPPKVDSQVIIMDRRDAPLYGEMDERQFFKVVKAGFSERRKKLRSSLAGGLVLDKSEVDKMLLTAGISADARAQELTIAEWVTLAESQNQ